MKRFALFCLATGALSTQGSKISADFIPAPNGGGGAPPPGVQGQPPPPPQPPQQPVAVAQPVNNHPIPGAGGAAAAQAAAQANPAPPQPPQGAAGQRQPPPPPPQGGGAPPPPPPGPQAGGGAAPRPPPPPGQGPPPPPGGAPPGGAPEGPPKVEMPDPFEWYIPERLENLVLPNVVQNEKGEGKGWHFELPDQVVDRYLKASPNDVFNDHTIYGNIYNGYKSGKRIDDLMALIGEDIFDDTIEYLVYDWLTGECKWTSSVWQQELQGWMYTDVVNSQVFAHVQTDVWSEVSGWFEWYLNENLVQSEEEAAEDSLGLHSDEMISWKEEIAAKLLVLKSSPALVHERPMLRGKSKLKKPLKEGKKPKKPLINPENSPLTGSRRRLLSCPFSNPAELFGSKYIDVSNFVAEGFGEDFGGLFSNVPTSLMAQLNVGIHTCHGVCMQMKFGITWDVVREEAYLHASYGLAQLIKSDAASFMELAFFDTADSLQTGPGGIKSYADESVFNDFYRVGTFTNKLGVNYIFDKEWNHVGISFGHPYKEVTDQESEHFKVNFYWENNVRLATYNPLYEPSIDEDAEDAGEELVDNGYSFREAFYRGASQAKLVHHAKTSAVSHSNWYYIFIVASLTLIIYALRRLQLTQKDSLKSSSFSSKTRVKPSEFSPLLDDSNAIGLP